MDDKAPKKKRKERRGTLRKKSLVAKKISVLHEINEYDVMDGLKKIVLSPITQNFIGCSIGFDITAEIPWIFVEKEKILDNLEFHEHSSEFLPIKDLINGYPEPQMLVGSFSHNQETEEDFYVCTTLDVKDKINSIIQEEREAIELRLRMALNLEPRPWISLGSEEEVDSSLLINFRPLFLVEIESKFPIHDNCRYFRMRLVEESENGYIELLPGRFGRPNLYKKKIDSIVQVTSPKQDMYIQTINNVPMNKGTQYSFEYNEIKMTDAIIKNIKIFLMNLYENLGDILNYNFYINLYCDDYMEFPNRYEKTNLRDPDYVLWFQDVITCKNKKVSSLTWNSLISGIIAASYSKSPSHCIITEEPFYNEPFETVFETHIVLLWCYTDTVNPKLYLHSDQDVTALSFCPYDANILVGGCNSGQILVWDITNKLQEVEARENITQLETQHRMRLKPLMLWMKYPASSKNIYPCVKSALEYCHKSPVTDIQWIPPDYYITKNGQFEPCENGEQHMQFLTTSVDDSTVLVWDLKKTAHEEAEPIKPRKRLQRLSKFPIALNIDVSPLKEKHRTFVPIFELVIRNPITRKRIPILNLLLSVNNCCYNALNPETVEDIYERTYFEIGEPEEEYNCIKRFSVSSIFGGIYTCNWDGHTFDQGRKINTELCSTYSLTSIHDGPIVNCSVSPFLPSIYLTIGGSVLAIWDSFESKTPLFWRKSKIRYLAGMWSLNHPSAIVVVTQDMKFELWNFLEQTDKPIRLLKYKGNKLLTLHNIRGSEHVSKKTFISTNGTGEMKVFFVKTSIFDITENVMNDTQKLLANAKKRKQLNVFWATKYKKFDAEGSQKVEAAETTTNPEDEASTDNDPEKDKKTVTEEVEEKVESTIKTKKTADVQESPANKWQRQQEILMYHILMKKNHLNVDEINKEKVHLDKYLEEQSSKQRKVDQILKTKDAFFAQIQSKLIPHTKLHIRKKITISFPHELNELMKARFIEEYKVIEKLSMIEIGRTNYRFIYDWSASINEARQRLNKNSCLKGKRLISEMNLFTADSTKMNTFEGDVHSY